MQATKLFGILLAAMAACGGEPSECDAMRDFRRALADNERFAIRKGGVVDIAMLRSAFAGFAASTGREGPEHLNAYGGMSRSTRRPSEPGFVLVGKLDESTADAISEESWAWVTCCGMPELWQRIAATCVPIIALKSGMPSGQMVDWGLFVGVAAPELGWTSSESSHTTLVADYGGEDVFVMTVEHLQGRWRLRGFEWWRPT